MKKETQTLVDDLKRFGKSEDFLDLKARVENVFYNIYHKKIKKSALSEVDKENFYESLDAVLMECVNSFDPTRNMAFSTYFYSMVRFKALNCINKQKSVRTTTITLDYSSSGGDVLDSQDFVEENQDNFDESEKSIELFSFIDRIKNSGILDSKINSMIFDLKVKGEKNAFIVKEIANEFSFSKEIAYKKIKQLNTKIRKYYE